MKQLLWFSFKVHLDRSLSVISARDWSAFERALSKTVMRFSISTNVLFFLANLTLRAEFKIKQISQTKGERHVEVIENYAVLCFSKMACEEISGRQHQNMGRKVHAKCYASEMKNRCSLAVTATVAHTHLLNIINTSWNPGHRLTAGLSSTQFVYNLQPVNYHCSL